MKAKLWSLSLIDVNFTHIAQNQIEIQKLLDDAEFKSPMTSDAYP